MHIDEVTDLQNVTGTIEIASSISQSQSHQPMAQCKPTSEEQSQPWPDPRLVAIQFQNMPSVSLLSYDSRQVTLTMPSASIATEPAENMEATKNDVFSAM